MCGASTPVATAEADRDQPNTKFKIGQVVRVLRNVDEDGSPEYLNQELIGKEGTIVRIETYSEWEENNKNPFPYTVQFSDESYGEEDFADEDLELVIKVGDRVEFDRMSGGQVVGVETQTIVTYIADRNPISYGMVFKTPVSEMQGEENFTVISGDNEDIAEEEESETVEINGYLYDLEDVLDRLDELTPIDRA